MKASVFIGTSVDGFIARASGGLDFLPPGGGEPHGYDEFMATVDALVTSALFYNGKDVAIRQGFKNTGAWTELEGTARPVFVAPWSLTFSTGG